MCIYMSHSIKKGCYRIYHIQPNYCTVNLGFSKILRKLAVNYVSSYTKGTFKKKTRSAKDISNDANAMFL